MEIEFVIKEREKNERRSAGIVCRRQETERKSFELSQ